MEKTLASKNQREFIANLIYRRKDDNEYLKKIWLDTPKNNENHPDICCDYTQIILAERLSRLSQAQATYILNAWQGERGYSVLTARKILIENIIN
jgi:hypothetical protein